MRERENWPRIIDALTRCLNFAKIQLEFFLTFYIFSGQHWCRGRQMALSVSLWLPANQQGNFEGHWRLKRPPRNTKGAGSNMYTKGFLGLFGFTARVHKLIRGRWVAQTKRASIFALISFGANFTFPFQRFSRSEPNNEKYKKNFKSVPFRFFSFFFYNEKNFLCILLLMPC